MCPWQKACLKHSKTCVNSRQKCAYLVFWLVYLTLLYTNSELTLIKQSTFATTVCDSPANTSYADCAPHISSSLLKCWVSLHYLNFEGVGFLEPKVQQPTAANAKCSRHSIAKVEYFCSPANIRYFPTLPILHILLPCQCTIFSNPSYIGYFAPIPIFFQHSCQGRIFCSLQMSNIFHPCLHCIFCCPAIIEYLAIHPISDILHQYQIWISNTSARVEYFAYLSMLNIMLHCQDGISSYTVKVNYCAPLSRLFCALFSCWQKIMRKLFSLLLLCSHKRIYLFSSFCTKRRSLSQQVRQKKKCWNCGFWSNRTLHYFPLSVRSSVRPFARHRRDISTFLDILTVYTMKTIYFLNAYLLGW